MNNCINGVTVTVLDCKLEPFSGQTKDYEIGIGCFSTEHAMLMSKSKDWLAWQYDSVSEWATPGLLF